MIAAEERRSEVLCACKVFIKQEMLTQHCACATLRLKLRGILWGFYLGIPGTSVLLKGCTLRKYQHVMTHELSLNKLNLLGTQFEDNCARPNIVEFQVQGEFTRESSGVCSWVFVERVL